MWPNELTGSSIEPRPDGVDHRRDRLVAANGCIQPGIVSTGTYALDTNVSGNTSIDMPCAACADPETRPMRMNIHVNANPNTSDQPEGDERVDDESGRAEADGEADRQRGDDAPRDERGVGEGPPDRQRQPRDRQRAQAVERHRVVRSSATPAAALIPENSTPVTTKPGTRKST